MYDTVAQYEQVTGADVEDWHPPVMVRLWQLLRPLGSGTAPMFVIQVVLYALGFAFIIAALSRAGRPRAAIAVALLALSPLLVGWQMVVLKDGQMLASLVAAFGIVAHYRLSGRSVPLAAAAGAIIFISYATLVRANALFATVPLGLFLLRRPASLLVRVSLAGVAVLLLLGLEPLINTRLFEASPSGVAKTEPLFDLAAIAAAVPASVAPFSEAERSGLITKNCVKPFFWDPVREPSACGPITERANALSERELYLDLARAIASHPLVYAMHRMRHWNATERWLVQPGLIDAAPPRQGEPNEDGLLTPSNRLVPRWQDLAALEAGTPLGWPMFWTTLALLAVPLAWQRRAQDTGALALALLVSALSLEASFLVVSIASDLRYHLWSMVAAALGVILLADHDFAKKRRTGIACCAILLTVVAGGAAARSTLPPAPASYQAMLHAPA